MAPRVEPLRLKLAADPMDLPKCISPKQYLKAIQNEQAATSRKIEVLQIERARQFHVLRPVADDGDEIAQSHEAMKRCIAYVQKDLAERELSAVSRPLAPDPHEWATASVGRLDVWWLGSGPLWPGQG